MSSKYTAQTDSNPSSSLVTRREKVAGALRKPKGIYRHWKCPNGVTKAETGTDGSSRGTCQYPRVMSNFVRKRAFPMRSMRSSTLGNGKGSGTVTALTFLKSVQSRNVPSDFGTSTTGDANGLSLSSTIPSRSSLSNSCLST